MIKTLYETDFHEGKISINWDKAKEELQISGYNGRTTIAFEYVWEVCKINNFAQDANFQRVIIQYFNQNTLENLTQQLAKGLE